MAMLVELVVVVVVVVVQAMTCQGRRVDTALGPVDGQR